MKTWQKVYCLTLFSKQLPVKVIFEIEVIKKANNLKGFTPSVLEDLDAMIEFQGH